MSEVLLNRLVPLWNCLCYSAQGVGCATREDIDYFSGRARTEGIPFLTYGLAGFGRSFLTSIRRGYIVREEFTAARFATQVGSTLPRFLYSAVSKVFDDDGNGIGCQFVDDDRSAIRSWTPNSEAEVAVRQIRQLTTVFSKMQLPHSTSSTNAVIERFIANERDLADHKGRLWATSYADTVKFPHWRENTQSLTEILLRARRLVHKVLCNVDPREIVPKHGSGASACRTRPWERYDRILFDPVQNTIWPWLEYACAGKEHCSQLLSTPYITDGYPKIARGVLVPKDYRGQRLISCEPGTSMYYQQGMMSELVSHLESCSDTSGFVNFTNQQINQVLAREGSVDRRTATLDLKDASDRLSWDLVVLLWPNHWYNALSAVRSKVTEIDLPSGKTIRVPLRKHAPMGSAVCFPVMALTIWALIKAAQFSRHTACWVYGDDIVVASRDAIDVCDLLESVSLAVNRDKSFYGGTPFRESCGKEYWNGTDVTPVYCRYNPSDDDSEAASLCTFANNIALTRGTTEAYSITKLVHEITGIPIKGVDDANTTQLDELLSLVTPEGVTMVSNKQFKAEVKPRPFLLYGCHSLCTMSKVRTKSARCSRKGTNFNKKLHRLKVPTPVNIPVSPESWGYVLRSSLIGGDLGFAESVPLAKRVVYKYGWVSISW